MRPRPRRGKREALTSRVRRRAAVLVAAIVTEVVIVGKTSPIGRRALGEAVARMLLPATLKDGALWRQAIAPVLDAVPPDALDRLARAPQVFVVPDEFIWRVPFEALPIGDDYLGGRAAVTYLSSITARLRSVAAPAGPPNPLVAIGAPEIAPAMSTQLARTAPDWTIRSADDATRELTAISAGRWTIEDAAAQVFLGELHRQLHDGEAPKDAELKARQAVRRTAAWAAPFYWSGWIGIGQ